MSACWWLLLSSYRHLNKAKLEVLHRVEVALPVRVFTDEWAVLQQPPASRWQRRYAEQGKVERAVPWIFAALWVVLFVGRVA